MTVSRRGLLAAGAAVPAAGLLAAAPAAAAVAPPPGPFGDGTYAMLCLGDSITYGSTSDPANGGNGYRAYLLDDLRIRNERPSVNMVGSLYSGSRQLYHEGHPGWTINQIAGTVGTGLAPQFVIFLGGANDFGDAYKRTWQQARDDTSALLDKLLGWAPWVRVVLCEQIFMSGNVSHDLTKNTWQQQAYNAALPALVDSKGGRVVIAKSSVIGQDMLDVGGVHPNDLGYRWLAYVIYQALAPWLGHDVGAPERYMTNIPVPGGSPRPTWIL